MKQQEHHTRIRHFGYECPITPEIITYYDSTPRDGDVALAIALAGDPINPSILEIGCGVGRDAAIITPITTQYLGIEESPDLIKLSKQRAPLGSYQLADPVQFDYGQEQHDIVFSFAALRYYTRDELAIILRKVHRSLKVGGILYLSLNYGDHYTEERRQDRFGMRQIVLYNPDLVLRLAGPGYKKLHEATGVVLGAKWFEVALRRDY